MPNSIVLISAQEKLLQMELLLPLAELELSFGKPLQSDPAIVEKYSADLRTYIQNHIKVRNDSSSFAWPMKIDSLKADPLYQKGTQSYFRELDVFLTVAIPSSSNPRKFNLDYDVIIHQVVTHFAVVKIVQDFETGVTSENPVELGLVQLDIQNNNIPPFTVDLTLGNQWLGIKRFILLGMDHILTGYDHLLFLLMLLLVTPVACVDSAWSKFESNGTALRKILRTITAFTLGHSLTLLFVAFYSTGYWIQTIEVLIATSIFTSALHVLRPLFPGREMLIALGFGLIHGMAFGNSLAALHLDSTTRVTAVLSFNIGIEVMQLAVIAVVIPLLLLLKGRYFRIVQISGGVFGCAASLLWITERITNQGPLISKLISIIRQ